MLDAHHAIIEGLAEELHLRRCDFAWWITIDQDDDEDDWFIWEWTTITSIINDKHRLPHTNQHGFAPITTKTTDKTAYVTIKDGKFIITQSDEDHDIVSVSSHTPIYDPSFTPPSWTCDLGDPKLLEMLQHQLNTTSFSLDL